MPVAPGSLATITECFTHSSGEMGKMKDTASDSMKLERFDGAVDMDIIVIGAGFGGMSSAIAARRAGFKNVLILEKAQDVGGTWRENTYPGVACDVPSHLYSLATHPNPDWTRTYSPGEEIRAYLERVARDEGLYDICRFGQEVTSAEWDSTSGRWQVTTATGQHYTSRALIAAPGPLHVPKLPDIPGLESFGGKVMHSAKWDHAYDLTGKRAAVIGTGASAIQFVPEIAGIMSHVTVFQRTAPWVVPRPGGETTAFRRWVFRNVPGARRFYRGSIMFMQEKLHHLFRGEGRMSRIARRVSLRHMRKAISDPALRARITPNYHIGCKRILFSNNWFPALARSNVEIETASIAEITRTGIRTRDGVFREVDVLILGTGFQVTEAPMAIPVRGRDGITLGEAWSKSDGMSAYLGSSLPGFPNFFLILGPNSGLGHNSVVLMAEAQAEHAVRVLKSAAANGTSAVEPRPELFRDYQDEIQGKLADTVWQTGGCASWYQDQNGRNTTLWPGDVRTFQARTRAAGLSDFREV